MSTYYSARKGQTVDMSTMHPGHLINALNKQANEAVKVKATLTQLDNEAEAFYNDPDNQGVELYYGEQERKQLREAYHQVGELATELVSRGFALEAKLIE